MRIPNPFKCDSCGKQKDASNRWWMIISLPYKDFGEGWRVFVERHGEIRNSNNTRQLGNCFLVIPWEVSLEFSEGLGHACSESCALKKQSEWMGKFPAGAGAVAPDSAAVPPAV